MRTSLASLLLVGYLISQTIIGCRGVGGHLAKREAVKQTGNPTDTEDTSSPAWIKTEVYEGYNAKDYIIGVGYVPITEGRDIEKAKELAKKNALRNILKKIKYNIKEGLYFASNPFEINNAIYLEIPLRFNVIDIDSLDGVKVIDSYHQTTPEHRYYVIAGINKSLAANAILKDIDALRKEIDDAFVKGLTSEDSFLILPSLSSYFYAIEKMRRLMWFQGLYLFLTTTPLTVWESNLTLTFLIHKIEEVFEGINLKIVSGENQNIYNTEGLLPIVVKAYYKKGSKEAVIPDLPLRLGLGDLYIDYEDVKTDKDGTATLNINKRDNKKDRGYTFNNSFDVIVAIDKLTELADLFNPIKTTGTFLVPLKSSMCVFVKVHEEQIGEESSYIEQKLNEAIRDAEYKIMDTTNIRLLKEEKGFLDYNIRTVQEQAISCHIAIIGQISSEVNKEESTNFYISKVHGVIRVLNIKQGKVLKVVNIKEYGDIDIEATMASSLFRNVASKNSIISAGKLIAQKIIDILNDIFINQEYL